MENLILNKIDNVIQNVKSKYGLYGATAADMFIIISFEIIRCEITLKKISSNSVSAITEIATTTSHFYYFRDYPSLYKDIQNVYIEICKIDKRFNSADLKSKVNFELESWIKCISGATNNLLKELPMSYFTKNE